MYEVTKKPEYKNNAKRIISNILLFETELQEKKYFPGEGLQRFSLDLGGGSAGINLLLNKYLGKNRNTLFVWDSLIGGHRSEVF